MRTLTIYHRLLIYFLKRKNTILESHTGITYILKSDLSNAADFSKEQVINFLNGLCAANDKVCCPWCVILENNCRECGYGFQHGRCAPLGIGKSSNTYGEIADNLGRKIYQLKEIQDLIKDIRVIYKAIPYIL